jgi:hypothetical protein
MRHHRSLAIAGATLAAGLLLVVGTVGGAVAARPAVITIAIDFELSETFTTESAVLCSSGIAYTDFHFGAGNFVTAGSFHLDKTLVCDDGSGSFTIRVNAGTNFVVGQGTTGGWSVVPGSGTGDYIGLHGGGNIVGINSDTPPIDLTDYYFGRVQL